MTKEGVLEKLKSRTIIQEVTECWLWQGALHPRGYGKIRIESKDFCVHRLSAWIYHDLDLSNRNEQANHFCSNQMCWNPQHIYVGNQKENIGDAINLGKHNSCHETQKTHCPKGHEYTPENTYIQGTSRSCKICRATSNKEWYASRGGRW